jgi:hypothetical protein
MKFTHVLEQTTGGGNGLRLAREYQRNLLAVARQFGQLLPCQVWIPETLDAIVVRVPLVQLNFENTKGLLILLEGE